MAATNPATAQADDEPCSLLTFEEVAEWTGITVQNTLPQGNLKVVASCTFGGVDRPPVLTYAVTQGSAARSGYESNLQFPGVESVADVGQEAAWVPMTRGLAVLVRENLYVLVRVHEQAPGGETTSQGLAKEVVGVLTERLTP